MISVKSGYQNIAKLIIASGDDFHTAPPQMGRYDKVRIFPPENVQITQYSYKNTYEILLILQVINLKAVKGVNSRTTFPTCRGKIYISKSHICSY